MQGPFSAYLILLLTGLCFSCCRAVSVYESGAIFIRADGSIEPQTANITTIDNVTYFFSSSNYGEIVVERSNIVIDGNGHLLEGTGAFYSEGISLSGVKNVTVRNTRIDNFYYGVWLDWASNNSIEGNSVAGCYYGVWLESSDQNSICNSIIANNDYGVWFDSFSNHNRISNNNIVSNHFGIWLEYSSHNTVDNNNITRSNWNGIRVNSSSNNSITGNNVTRSNWEGVWLGPLSSHNNVESNNIAENDIGVKLISSNNSVSGNIVRHNRCGVWLGSSHNNSLNGNSITDNRYGVSVSKSSNNIIYHNSIDNNSQQVLSDASMNVWSKGYPLGGNYWSDYNGSDVRRGLHQNETGCDGVGDTPYVIDADEADQYPLMKPYAGSHDIGLTTSVSKTVVAHGLNITIGFDVRIVNHGMHQEIFNFSFQIIGAFAQLQTLTLESRDSTHCSFTWNTTNLAHGDYVILAQASPVSEEEYITDNTFTSIIYIGVSGDVDGNHVVNMLDLYEIATNLGAEIGGPDYIPNYDIDGNGFTDTNDLDTATANFGQTDP